MLLAWTKVTGTWASASASARERAGSAGDSASASGDIIEVGVAGVAGVGVR